MVDQNTENLIIVGALFASLLIIFLYLRYRVQRRHSELRREPVPTREVLDDRAFNQIRLARAAAQRLEHAGIDIAGIPALLDRAEEARQRGDAETASAFALSANESLRRLQSGAPSSVPSIARSSSAPTPSPSGPDPTGPLPPDEEPAPAPQKLPPNKAESRFQMTLLADDIARGGASPDAIRGAQVLLGDAREAFDKGQYTEALRLGLKGRRLVGGRIDSLPPASTPDSSAGVSPASAEGAASRCASCGQPLRPNDKFCRGCGAPQGTGRCAQCGQSLGPSDVFCGACGAPVRA